MAARQLYGLWALGLLLASLIVGPLTAVLPWPPARGPLMYARRAVGVCALLFAALHVACYLASVGRRDWRELYTPGALWVIGLILGTLALAGMAALGATSFDAAVKRMGGRSWKRLHRTVYLLLAVVFAHALATGADFGLNRGPDVTARPTPAPASPSPAWRPRGWRCSPCAAAACGGRDCCRAPLCGLRDARSQLCRRSPEFAERFLNLREGFPSSQSPFPIFERASRVRKAPSQSSRGLPEFAKPPPNLREGLTSSQSPFEDSEGALGVRKALSESRNRPPDVPRRGQSSSTVTLVFV